jgi:hypothetical protein
VPPDLFWEELCLLNPDLSTCKHKGELLKKQIYDWVLHTIYRDHRNNSIGFSLYSPSGHVRVTNFNQSRRGYMKKKQYMVDVTNYKGEWLKAVNVAEVDFVTDAFKQAINLEIQYSANHV